VNPCASEVVQVGQLAYDADVDGNGALDFHEFSLVIDQLK